MTFMRLRAAVISLTGMVCGAAASPGDVIVVPHEFRASEGGSFGGKTLSQLDSNEFKGALILACAFYGVDCSEAAVAIGEAAYYATPYINASDISTTAWIDRHPGEEYYAKFAAPPGYTTCKAVIDVGNGSITGPSTFNGSIQRMPGGNNDGIGLYAVVPKNRQSPQWVSFRVDVEFVRPGKLGEYGCWPDRTLVFQCTGQNCTTFPGARR